MDLHLYYNTMGSGLRNKMHFRKKKNDIIDRKHLLLKAILLFAERFYEKLLIFSRR